MSNIKFDEELLNGLSQEEKECALNILKEFSSGDNHLYNKILYDDWKEQPVDILTFIKDDNYLGKAWKDPEGNIKLFPYWEGVLKKLFPDPYTTKVNNLIESGGRGLGKSEIAITCMLYIMYRLMCLRNPHEYYNLKVTERFAFAFMNITKKLSEDIGINKFQSTIQLSPWFLARGEISQRNNLPYWTPPDYINIIIGSQPSHVIGQPILAAFFDEIDFIRNQDVDIQKERAKDMLDTAIGGMKTRFTNRGNNPGLIILASSKRSDKSFLETHMRMSLENEPNNIIIVDEPTWNIRPQSEYSGKKFNVALGNKFLASQVIADDDHNLQYWTDKGYSILQVPIEYKSKFLEEIDRALADYAGIASSELTKYISGERFNSCKSEKIKNLFTRDIIEVGNSPTDSQQYYDYVDLDRLDNDMRRRPLYIHLDMSVSGDKTGIAGIWIKGKKQVNEGEPDANSLFYQLAFSVAVKAPKGYQVSFEKNRKFIIWLRDQGFNIKGITADTFQSYDTLQELKSKGFECDTLSVDRVEPQSRICRPYQYFKTTIYENRFVLYKEDCSLLTEEVINLERNANSGKIDHPDNGRFGSKDCSDAVAGAMFNASKHAEEFAYDYGETLVASIDSNTERSYEEDFVNQLTEDLKQHQPSINNSSSIFDPIGGSSLDVLDGIVYW